MEILFILVLALLIFGPRRLPEVGRTIGKALGEFRRATTDLKRTVNTELALEEDEARPTSGRRPPPFPAIAGGAGDADSPTVVRSAAGSHPRAPRRTAGTAAEDVDPGRAAGEPATGGDGEPAVSGPPAGDDR